MKTLRPLILLCSFAFMVLSAVHVNAQQAVPPKVNLFDLIKESQQWVKEDDRMRLSWWIPQEYWRIALADNPQVSPEALREIEKILENYVLVCAADMRISTTTAKFTFSEEIDIRKTIMIIDSTGKKYMPLTEKQISTEARMMAQSIKPVLAQALGEMGKGIHIFFFSVQDSKKQNMVSATRKGTLRITHSGSEFVWALPLSTLLPPRICPVDQETMKGNWNYCPFHGTKLDN
jgi:hypothetical protein